jgi:hypothetical protein
MRSSRRESIPASDHSRDPFGRRTGFGAAVLGLQGWPSLALALPSGELQSGGALPGLVGCSPGGLSRVCAPATDVPASTSAAVTAITTPRILHLLASV